VNVSTTTRAQIVDRLRHSGCVFAEEEAELLIDACDTEADLHDKVASRVLGRPLEYILGWAEFAGLRIFVADGVFVPRRRTEFLVHEALALGSPNTVMVDLCCGSGAVGAAIAATLDIAEWHAADIDPIAARCARHNVGSEGQVYCGDLYEPLPDRLQGRIGLLTVNAPYVPTKDVGLMPREARIYEAPAALDGGVDGLDVQRRVAAQAPLWLAVGGHLLMETSAVQRELSLKLCTDAGLAAQIVQSPDWDATLVIAQKTA
jgi:release factor glutamine methyltransferase